MDPIFLTVHLRVRQMDQSNPKTLFPSTSAITYWQIEMEEGPISGIITFSQGSLKPFTLAVFMSFI